MQRSCFSKTLQYQLGRSSGRQIVLLRVSKTQSFVSWAIFDLSCLMACAGGSSGSKQLPKTKLSVWFHRNAYFANPYDPNLEPQVGPRRLRRGLLGPRLGRKMPLCFAEVNVCRHTSRERNLLGINMGPNRLRGMCWWLFWLEMAPNNE